MNDVFSKYNIIIKNLGLNTFELSKDKVKIHTYIKEEGIKFSNKICFRLIQGNVNKVNDIMETICLELETLNKDKKACQNKNNNNFNTTLKMTAKI